MTAILMTAGKARVCLQCHRELVVSCGPNGPRCAQRIRGAVAMALSMADRFGYTAEQIEAAGELLADGGIVESTIPGTFIVAASDGQHFYRTQAGSCTCARGLLSGKPCRHRAAAEIKTALG